MTYKQTILFSNGLLGESLPMSVAHLGTLTLIVVLRTFSFSTKETLMWCPQDHPELASHQREPILQTKGLFQENNLIECSKAFIGFILMFSFENLKGGVCISFFESGDLVSGQRTFSIFWFQLFWGVK